MTPERWQQITGIFNGAVAIADTAGREAYLDAACANDASLRAEVDSLLAVHFSSSSAPDGVGYELQTRSRLAAGAMLGPYRVEDLVGAGGMGEVYRARDTRLGRTVALKILPTHLRAHPQLLARFEREARAIALLNHPHICTLYDIGRHEDIDFIVMELVEGETLRARLSRGPLALAEALSVAAQVAEALAAAHAKGIIHRDIKPSNIIVTFAGRVKVVDFGLARESPLTGGDHSGRDDPTEPGVRVGTPFYMSPEQALGQPLDARTDLFSLGVVLFECLTGNRPFEGTTGYSYLQNLISGSMRSVTDLRPEVPADLQTVLARCLERDAEKRLDSAGMLGDELDRISRGRARSRPRRWLPWSGAAAVVVAAVVGIAVLGPNAEPPPDGTALAQLRQFTTSSGEESDSHFSPDEEWVSFIAAEDGQRRLFAQQIDGGVRRPVTLPPGLIQSHVWSPDGKAYACLMYQDSEWSVQIVGAIFGGDVPIQTVRAPQILRTARLLRWVDRSVYLQVEGRGATPSLQRLDLDRGTFETLSGPWTKMQVRGFDVSSSRDVLWTAQESPQRDDLWSAHVSGGGAKPLTSPADASRKRLPLWNRDGRSVVYQSAKGGQVDLWELDLQTGRSERRTSDPGIERPESTSKSGSISFQIWFQKTALWKWSGRDRRGTPISDEGLSEFAPSSSRNGTVRVAFQRSMPSPLEGFLQIDSDLFLADVSSAATNLAGARRVGTGFAPQLSPDGRRLAHFQRAQPGSVAKLVLTNLATNGSEVISSSVVPPSGSNFPVDWVDQNVAWASPEELWFGERVQRPDGTAVSRLTRYRIGSGATAVDATATGGRISDIFPASDGRRIAYLTSEPTTEPEREKYQLHVFDSATMSSRMIRDIGSNYLVRFRGWLASDAGLVVAQFAEFHSDLTWSFQLMTVALDGSVRPSGRIDHVAGVSQFVPSTRDLYFTGLTNGVANLFAFSFTNRKPHPVTENTVRDVTFGGVTPLGPEHIIGIRHEQTRNINLLDARPRSPRAEQ